MKDQIVLWIDYPGNRSQLSADLSKLVEGHLIQENSSMIRTDLLEYTVLNNPAYDEEKRKELDGGFFHYKFYCEIEPLEAINSEILTRIKTELSQLLLDIWEAHIPAVISADFEDELPEKGGYLSLKTPKPL